MAYKDSYRIPVSLNRTILDHEINLSRSLKPIGLRVILFYLLSFTVLLWLVQTTFIKDASISLIVLFCTWYLIATVFLGQYSKVKELKLQAIPALVNYLQKNERTLYTRSASSALEFYNLIKIKNVEADGLIEFTDNTYGYAYNVVGSASILVFDDDKHAIIDRVDKFYRKLQTGVELIWLTTKQPQKIYNQLANLERKNLNLVVRDAELFELLDEQCDILTNYVGSRFNSIHQYLVVKASNLEQLMWAHNMLHREMRESGLMLKDAQLLDRDDFLELAKQIYVN